MHASLRIEIAQRVYRRLAPSMDSVPSCGLLVAKLMGAFAIDTTLDFFQPITDNESEFLRLISDLFGNDDEVWTFITVECDQMENGCTCESCTRQLADCGITPTTQD